MGEDHRAPADIGLNKLDVGDHASRSAGRPQSTREQSMLPHDLNEVLKEKSHE
jgi:hypothetical protein